MFILAKWPSENEHFIDWLGHGHRCAILTGKISYI